LGQEKWKVAEGTAVKLRQEELSFKIMMIGMIMKHIYCITERFW
jgi:hypothetical protein